MGYTPYVVEILSFGSNMNKAMMTCEFVNGNFNDEVLLNLNFSQETETLVFLVILLGSGHVVKTFLPRSSTVLTSSRDPHFNSTVERATCLANCIEPYLNISRVADIKISPCVSQSLNPKGRCGIYLHLLSIQT